jgi:hypothetical protein
MASQRGPESIASYWGVDPTAVPVDDDAAVRQYWGLDAVAPDPFTAGASAAGIAPPQAPPPVAAPPADPFAAGAANAGIAPPAAERVYNDFIPPGGGPASIASPQVALIDQPKGPGGVSMAPPSPATAPTMSGGPTAAENAQFERFKAGLAPARPVRPAPMAARGPGNADPFGLGAAQRGQLSAMDDRMSAMNRAAGAEGDLAVMRADHERNLARMQEEDAAIARAEHELGVKHFDEAASEVGRQLDDVKAKKIDPLRTMKESPGLSVLAVIGGAVGGFYQGMTGGQSNSFIDDLNRQIDRGIAEDEREIRDEKFALGEGMNMLHQQRQAWKDDNLSRAQMRNLMYEAAKNEIAAEAERAGTAIAKAHADDAIAQVHQQQEALKAQIATQNQARAASAAAAATARAKEVQAAMLTQYEKNLASGMEPGRAVDWARHLIGLVYAPGTPGNDRPAGGESPSMLTREQRGKVAMEHQEAQHSSDEFNSQIDAIKKHPALSKLGLTTGAMAHLGQRVAPESAKVEQDLKQINTQILQAVGKVAKDADGKPNKSMLEELKHTFSVLPTDTPEMAMQKLEGARDAVNALARQQGATGAPRPGARHAEDAALGAKPVR